MTELPPSTIDSNTNKEYTIVLYGNENIQKATLKTFFQIKVRLDGCLDSSEIPMHVQLEQIFSGLTELKKRGITINMVSEVTPET